MAVQMKLVTDPGDCRVLPQEKAMVLRTYEAVCYQVAFYILGEEKQAAEAAKHTLTALYHCVEWFGLPDSCRLAKAKREAMKHSLEYRKRALSQAL